MQPAAGDAVQLPVYDCWMIDWLIVSCVYAPSSDAAEKYNLQQGTVCATIRTKVGAAF
jgi:hypothetical protein